MTFAPAFPAHAPAATESVSYSKTVHHDIPHANHHGGTLMLNSRVAHDRKIRGKDRRMFRNIDAAALCRDTLRAAYGEEKSVHKAIAADTGQSPKAAENWTAGENPMSLVAFLNAYHNNTKFKAWARKILLMEEDIDPHFQAELSRFLSAVRTQP